MKILFITYFFAPYNCIGAVRTTRTAEVLSEIGHDVRVITAGEQNLDPNLISTFPEESVKRTKWIDLEKPIYLLMGKKKVASLKGNLHKASLKGRFFGVLNRIYQRMISIPDKHVGWYPYAVKEANSLIESGWVPDVIYASAMPYTSLMVAKKISGRHKIPWVGELRDLWSDNHYGYGGWIEKKIESNTLKTASSLITVSDPLQKTLQRKYHSIPVHTIFNAYDEKDFQLRYDKKTDDKKIKIVYTGTVYEGKRDPSPLLQTLHEYPVLRKSVQVDFFGSNLGFIEHLINKFNLHDCVKINGRVSRQEALEKQMSADILLLLTWNDPKEKGVLTGKLFEYIGSARPILSIGAVEDDASKLIISNGFGVATNEPSGINVFIKKVKEQGFDYDDVNRTEYERVSQIVSLEKVFVSVVQSKV